MPGLREDKFIDDLYKILEYFPEYAEILKYLIEEIQKVKEAKITAELQMLNNEDEEWDY